MKATASVLTLLTITLLLISCEQRKRPPIKTQKDTSNVLIDTSEQERLRKRNQIEDQDKLDSINDVRFLSEALKIAEKLTAQNKFKKRYAATVSDSSYPVDVDISSSFYFTSKFPHLIIRRNTPRYIYIDIFTKTDKQFKNVLSHKQWTMEYMGDTIRDINGDGLKDFVVNWYGVNGCCLKGFSNVYLQRADKSSFSNSFKFINPTFSPKEHIVRGVCYGHPGETEMYKYKWNGETIDTLEYIYFEENKEGKKTGKLLVSNKRPFEDNYKVLKRLNYVPAEYRKIEGYDWFIGNLNFNGDW